jgi:RNA polymerase sigma factor (sigma-70 family)
VILAPRAKTFGDIRLPCVRDVGHPKGDELSVAGTHGRIEAHPRVDDARVSASDLYARHAGNLFRFCLYQLRNRSEAEDAVQTTFLQAFRALQRGTIPHVERAWLLAIAQNVCRTMQRSSSRRRNVETDDPDAVVEAAATTNPVREEISELERALARIPANQRRALVMHEWRGLRYREIADVMGMSQTAVEMLAFRARKSLSEAINAEEAATQPSRLRRALDAGGMLSAFRALLTGGAAVHTVAGVGLAGLALMTFGAAPQASRRPPAAVSPPSRAATREATIAHVAIRVAPHGAGAHAATSPNVAAVSPRPVADGVTVPERATVRLPPRTSTPAAQQPTDAAASAPAPVALPVSPAPTPSLTVPSPPPAPTVTVPASPVTVPALPVSVPTVTVPEVSVTMPALPSP